MSAPVVRLPTMGRKKPTVGRHKYKQLAVRLHPDLRKQLEELTKQNLSDLSEEVRAAVIKHLKEHGLWPPQRDAN